MDDSVGDDRLPIVSRSGGRSVAALAMIVLLGSGCLAPGPAPLRTGFHSGSTGLAPGPSASAASPPAPGASEAGSAAGSPTPLPDPPPISRPLAAVTIVCDDWPTDPPPELVECPDAARLVLAVLGGERAAALRRLDIGFGDRCDEHSPCGPTAGVRWAVARSAAFEALHVRVARDADGELRVWPPVEGRRQPPPTFAAPPLAAPDLGPDAPARVRDRPALPFCGIEDETSAGVVDPAARHCFLDGVAAWVGVELVSRTTSTEGDAVTTVYRFTGEGAIERLVRAGSTWSGAACAISPIATIAVFVLVRPCEPIALGR